MGGIRFEGLAALGKRCAADRQLGSCPVGVPSPLIFDLMSIPIPTVRAVDFRTNLHTSLT